MADEENIEERLDNLRIQRQVIDEESAISERKAYIKEIKSKYGRNWRQIIGAVNKALTNATLKQYAERSRPGSYNDRMLPKKHSSFRMN